MLDRFIMAVIFGFLEETERAHLLLRLNQKTRNEVYPISTHNILFSQKMYDFSNPKTVKFVEDIVIGKLNWVNEVTFDSIDPLNISLLPEVVSNWISDNRFSISKLVFSNTIKNSTNDKNSK